MLAPHNPHNRAPICLLNPLMNTANGKIQAANDNVTTTKASFNLWVRRQQWKIVTYYFCSVSSEVFFLSRAIVNVKKVHISARRSPALDKLFPGAKMRNAR
jgi:hypothetical protein